VAEQFDVVIIGGGPGGYAAALYGASAGLSIAMIERDKVGGTCLHRGCVPAKELLETAHVFRTVSGAGQFGVNAGDAPTVDFGTTMVRKQQVVDGLWKGLTGLLKARKVTTLAGTGTYRGGGSVLVTAEDGSTTELEGANVVLASGSVARTIPGFEVDGRFVLTSDEVLSMPDLPATAAVIGGGAIGCEFASMMSDLGVKVTILEGLPKILPGLRRRRRRRRAQVLQAAWHRRAHRCEGDRAHPGRRLDPHRDRGVRRPRGRAGGRLRRAPAALGEPGARRHRRRGRRAGLRQGRRHLPDDRRRRLGHRRPRGHAPARPRRLHRGHQRDQGHPRRGPRTGRVRQGAVGHLLPAEVSFAGHSEDSAKEAGYDVVVSKHQFRGNGRALIVGEAEGLVKVIAEKQADGTGGTILGVHMVGPWVTEQLGQGYLAVNWGATVDEVASLIQPHPTLSELFGETVLSLTGRSLHG
jgi:dihydrolipoamide dehydrogenase